MRLDTIASGDGALSIPVRNILKGQPASGAGGVGSGRPAGPLSGSASKRGRPQESTDA